MEFEYFLLFLQVFHGSARIVGVFCFSHFGLGQPSLVSSVAVVGLLCEIPVETVPYNSSFHRGGAVESSADDNPAVPVPAGLVLLRERVAGLQPFEGLPGPSGPGLVSNPIFSGSHGTFARLHSS